MQQTKTVDVEVFELIKIRFLRFRKILRQNINEAKQNYFQTTFERFKHDIKQTWSVIDETLRRKKKETLSPTFLHISRTLNDPQEIANAFNTYFISIGQKLATQFNANHHFTAYLDDSSDRRLKLESIDEATTRKLIEHLKNKTSSLQLSVDGISNKLLKLSINELVTPLTIIINQMLNTGIFPEQLKISKVVPIYKANDRKLLTNYRPIALLPSISKIFEYTILEQLSNYFLENELFAPQQFGFRAKHSTELAALSLVDYLTYKLDAGKIPANIYIDLSKAFDTRSHSILLHKLSYNGVKGIAYSLIQSYLTQRQQIVEYNGCKSKKCLLQPESHRVRC